jgi:hypothetical protein
MNDKSIDNSNSKRGKMARNKGKTFERDVANAFKEIGFKAHRGQQFKGTADSPDVKVPEVPEINIECKAVEKLNVFDTMDKAIEDAKAQIPIIIHRKNRRGTLAIMRFEDFLKYFEVIYGDRRGIERSSGHDEEVDGGEDPSDGRDSCRASDLL